MSLENLCKDAIILVEDVASYIREERKKFSSANIQTKGKHDYVTHVDKEAELRLVTGLQIIFPESGFIAEEGTVAKTNSTYNWVIDPLDGTTNFIHGSPPYAISVAFMKNDEVILGIVYEIVNSECFYSYKDARAFLNGTPIRVSEATKVSESLIATGFPYNNFDRMEAFMNSLKFFFTQTHGVRRLGSAATDLRSRFGFTSLF